MPYYPILVDLTGKKVIVIGGGAVAQRKIETLLEYEAIVHVISRKLTPRLTEYLNEGKIKRLGQEYTEDALEGAFLVIAATDDPLLNHQVSKHASKRGLLINAVDQPSDCNFIVPAIIRRGDLLIAISTSGKSPALAKKVRKKLEKNFGNEYESFLTLMGRLREEVLSRGLSQEENRCIFQRLVDSSLLEAIGRKEWSEAASIINRILESKLSPNDVINYLKVE